MTLHLTVNLKPGAVNQMGRNCIVTHTTKHILILTGTPLQLWSVPEKKDRHITALGAWLTIHPITLGVANIKARCLHVGWQDVPPLVLKSKRWFSASRTGFAFYKERGQEMKITQPRNISNSVLKNRGIRFDTLRQAMSRENNLFLYN